MDLRAISDSQKDQFNKLATHIIQSFEWGEFRKKLGLPVLRYGLYKDNKLVRVFQLTLHQIPFTKYKIGYLPKGDKLDKDLAEALIKIGQEHNCAAIKVEPNIQISVVSSKQSLRPDGLQPSEIDKRFLKSDKSLFTKFNFLLDLTRSEDDIQKGMHSKFRYNIKVAQKHGVEIEIREDAEAFDIYLKLYFETTKRQKYHGHSPEYHKLAWESLKSSGIAKIALAFYTPPDSKDRVPLTAWMLYDFKDTLYYPYGGSSNLYRNVMATNLLAWEVIKFGQVLGLKTLDLWGALAPDASEDHPFQGFHRFKSGMGATLVEYLGTYDLVFNKNVYLLFNQIDKAMFLKVFLLKLLRK